MKSRENKPELSHIADARAKRADAAKRIAELERENGRLLEETQHWRKVHFADQDLKQRQIMKLQLELAQTKDALGDALQQIAWFRKQLFGRKSEQSIADAPEPETVTTEIEAIEDTNAVILSNPAKRGQQPGSKGHGRRKRDGEIFTQEQYSELPELCCSSCASPFKALPETDDSRLVHHAVDVWLEVWKRRRYVPQCDCPGNKIVTAPAPPRLFPRTGFATSMWIHLVVQKFLFQIPTHKTLQELAMHRLSVAQGTVTGGFQKIDDLVHPLYEEIVNHCRGADHWNADETSWRVFDDAEGMRKWWLWLISSPDAAVFLLDKTRSAAVPEQFFVASAGTLLTDRYSAYKALKDSIRKAFCWVHVRRDFIAISDGRPALKEWAQTWIQRIDELFDANRDRLDVLSNRAASQAMIRDVQLLLEQKIEQFAQRIDEDRISARADCQRKVLKSLKKHWEGLIVFVDDPRVPMDNNRAERLLRTPVVGRKNYLASGSEWSGHFAAKMFSIMQTWLMNGLNPVALLQEYFDECSKTPGKPPTDLSLFLPWLMTESRKAEFVLKNIP